MHVNTRTHERVFARTRACARAHTHWQTYVHTHTNTHARTHAHSYTHTHAHTHIQTHVHKHTLVTFVNRPLFIYFYKPSFYIMILWNYSSYQGYTLDESFRTACLICLGLYLVALIIIVMLILWIASPPQFVLFLRWLCFIFKLWLFVVVVFVSDAGYMLYVTFYVTDGFIYGCWCLVQGFNQRNVQHV